MLPFRRPSPFLLDRRLRSCCDGFLTVVASVHGPLHPHHRGRRDPSVFGDRPDAPLTVHEGLLDLLQTVFGQNWPTEPDAFRTGSLLACTDPGDDHAALELGEDAQELEEHQAASRAW